MTGAGIPKELVETRENGVRVQYAGTYKWVIEKSQQYSTAPTYFQKRRTSIIHHSAQACSIILCTQRARLLDIRMKRGASLSFTSIPERRKHSTASRTPSLAPNHRRRTQVGSNTPVALFLCGTWRRTGISRTKGARDLPA